MKPLNSAKALLACILCCFVVALPTFAAERFKRLSAADVNRLLVSRTVGDEAHWSYRFAKDGEVESMELGKTKLGAWRLSRGELCLDFTERGKPVSDCFEVWQAAKTIRLMRDGVLIAEGMLLDE